MAAPSSIQETIESARTVANAAPDGRRQELSLLIKDLEEAQTTVFVRTAEAKPMLERCAEAAAALKLAAQSHDWDEATEGVFADFERAVGKLRSTILVRTQRAT